MLPTVDLDLVPREASGLVPCTSLAVRDALGVDRAWWTVLDDGPIERCLALIGRRGDSWSTAPLEASVTAAAGRTDGAEALAAHDGWVYAFGSGYGTKEGRLDKARSFVARFREESVRVDEDGALRATLHVANEPFLLHRLLNDALADTDTPLVAWSPTFRERTVLKTRRKAVRGDKRWAWRLACDDTPIDVEGATFTPEGHLLLGLRLPVTRHGEPLIVELRHAARLFEGRADEPVPGRVFVLGGVGERRAPLGIRDLHVDAASGTLHALLGNLDSGAGENLLRREHPETARGESMHVAAALPAAPKTLRAKASRARSRLPARIVQRFAGLSRVEGVDIDADGHRLYLSDEEEAVRLHLAPAAAPAEAPRR